MTRRRTALPLILGKVIGDVDTLLQRVADGAMDIINLKIAKVGKLTKARQTRDLCISAGVPMTIENTWSGDIVTASIADLAFSPPEVFFFLATDFIPTGRSTSPAARPSR